MSRKKLKADLIKISKKIFFSQFFFALKNTLKSSQHKKVKKNFFWSNRPWVFCLSWPTGWLYGFKSSTSRKKIDFCLFKSLPGKNILNGTLWNFERKAKSVHLCTLRNQWVKPFKISFFSGFYIKIMFWVRWFYSLFERMRLKRKRTIFIHTNQPLITSFYIKKVPIFSE